MKRVIFICTRNSARSQMAEGLLRHLAGNRFQPYSAGTAPTRLHPLAVAAMQEIGIDISGQRAKDVSDYTEREFDYVITVCDQARETCPIFRGARHQLHWGLPDPAAAEGEEAARLMVFRQVRDDLAARIRQLIEGADP
jgi:arsenate reductase